MAFKKSELVCAWSPRVRVKEVLLYLKVAAAWQAEPPSVLNIQTTFQVLSTKIFIIMRCVFSYN